MLQRIRRGTIYLLHSIATKTYMHVHSMSPLGVIHGISPPHSRIESPDVKAVKIESSVNFCGEEPTAQIIEGLIWK